jgi:hypothetical protein
MAIMPVRYKADVAATAERAVADAEQIAVQDPFNYTWAEFHMRAFAGMFTPSSHSGLTREIYDRLPSKSKDASHVTATRCAEYLGGVGLAQEVHQSMAVLLKDKPTQRDYDSFFIGAVQTHTSTLGVTNTYNQAPYGNVKLPSSRSSLFAMSHGDQSGLRRDMVNFYEGELRDVVRTFGQNLGTVIKGYVEVAHASDNLGVVRYADSCVAK